MKKGICAKCGEYRWVNQHHIYPREHFGAKNNLETVQLCLDCHVDIHQELPKEKHFKDILLDHKSVNELIAEKRFERIPYDETGEFSNSAVNKGIINKGYVQCKFPTGFDGMAIAIGTDIGDGEVPVFAEFKDGAIKKLWIEFEEVSSPVP